jgi:class 3 adenylate cyclase/Tol biopolymer transport system component
MPESKSLNTESVRKLAAIMFTDIAGFTALMGQGESSAMKAVERNKNIQMPLVEKYGGKWHKDLGDGSLCSFSSSVNAVKCAMEIQDKLKHEVDFKVRIGIHLGDVNFSNGDIFGDGVNIAARIETEAAEGGICISESVYRSIKSNEEFEAVYYGKRKLKNVTETIKLFQIKAPQLSLKKRNRKYLPAPVIIILIMALTIFAGILGWRLKPSKGLNQVMRFSIVLPDNIMGIPNVALSNDGKTLAFSAELEGYPYAQMFIKPLNSFEMNHIPEAYYFDDPVFSPDDSKIAFGSQGILKVYSMEAGAITTFGTAASIQVSGLAWMNDALVYGPVIGNNKFQYSLLKNSQNEGSNEILLSPEDSGSEIDFRNPIYIEDANKLLYEVYSQSARSLIRILDLASMKSVDLLPGAYPEYISTGHILFKEGRNLMGVSFDPDEPENLGKPVRLLSGIAGGRYSVSSNGTLAYVIPQRSDYQLVLVDMNGEPTPIPMPSLARWASPSWSPDESKIVFSNPSTNSLWLYDLSKETSQLLLKHSSATAVWLPDGETLAFRNNEMRTIFSVNILDPNKVDTLVTNNNAIYPVSFSSDGNLMLYDEIHSTDKKNILLYNLSTNESIPFANSSAWENMGQFSPDDRLIAYCSDETGQFEIYLKKFPDTGEKWLVSDSGGSEPRWSKDGKLLFYRNDNRIMRVSITGGKDLDYGKAELVFEGSYPKSPFVITNFDINHDGSEFLMLQSVNAGEQEIRVIVNWFEELKALMRD